MKITQAMIKDAADQHIITEEQGQALIAFCQQHPQAGTSFSFANVLYYGGGLVAIGAMTVFMTLGWEQFGGAGILTLSLLYMLAGVWLTNQFEQRQLNVPTALTATFVVALTPLAVYGLQHALGLWPINDTYQDYHHNIRFHWFYMEMATLVCGAVVAWRYRHPFLLMPIAVTLWYLSMDLTRILSQGALDWELRALVSVYFGLLHIGLAFWVDMRSRTSRDYGFWLYMFGVLTFWGGLTAQSSDSELARFGYFVVNVLLIGAGTVLVRRVFVVFGGLGVAIYLGYLAFDLFKDSWLFPVALSAIGFGIIFLGIAWQKNEQAIARALLNVLPGPLQQLIARRR